MAINCAQFALIALFLGGDDARRNVGQGHQSRTNERPSFDSVGGSGVRLYNRALLDSQEEPETTLGGSARKARNWLSRKTRSVSTAEPPKRWFIALKKGVTDEDAKQLCDGKGVLCRRSQGSMGGLGFASVVATERQLARQLKGKAGMVQYVEPVTQVYANSEALPGELSNKAKRPLQAAERVIKKALNTNKEKMSSLFWNINHVSDSVPDAEPSYENGGTRTFPNNGGAGVRIYVVDTGIHTPHFEFAGRAQNLYDATVLAQNSRQCGFRSRDVSFNMRPACKRIDNVGHGTLCAGVAAGQLSGVAPNATVLGIKVTGRSGRAGISGFSDLVSDGLVWLRKDLISGPSQVKGTVVSYSLGAAGDIKQINDAVLDITNLGVAFVVVAGNEGLEKNPDACGYSPSILGSRDNSGVITVGALNRGGFKSSFSNSGSCVNIYAPGEKIWGAMTGTKFQHRAASGTSVASPQVAGVAALMLAESKTNELASDASLLKTKLLAESKLNAAADMTAAQKREGLPSFQVINIRDRDRWDRAFDTFIRKMAGHVWPSENLVWYAMQGIDPFGLPIDPTGWGTVYPQASV